MKPFYKNKSKTIINILKISYDELGMNNYGVNDHIGDKNNKNLNVLKKHKQKILLKNELSDLHLLNCHHCKFRHVKLPDLKKCVQHPQQCELVLYNLLNDICRSAKIFFHQ
jgi:hypothetical protein